MNIYINHGDRSYYLPTEGLEIINNEGVYFSLKKLFNLHDLPVWVDRIITRVGIKEKRMPTNGIPINKPPSIGENIAFISEGVYHLVPMVDEKNRPIVIIDDDDNLYTFERDAKMNAANDAYKNKIELLELKRKFAVDFSFIPREEYDAWVECMTKKALWKNDTGFPEIKEAIKSGSSDPVKISFSLPKPGGKFIATYNVPEADENGVAITQYGIPKSWVEKKISLDIEDFGDEYSISEYIDSFKVAFGEIADILKYDAGVIVELVDYSNGGFEPEVRTIADGKEHEIDVVKGQYGDIKLMRNNIPDYDPVKTSCINDTLAFGYNINNTRLGEKSNNGNLIQFDNHDSIYVDDRRFNPKSYALGHTMTHEWAHLNGINYHFPIGLMKSSTPHHVSFREAYPNGFNAMYWVRLSLAHVHGYLDKLVDEHGESFVAQAV